MNNDILETIKTRRTVKPMDYTGEIVPETVVTQILEAANWAPTHGYTEPWRFVVFSGTGKNKLLEFMTHLADGDTPNPIRYEKRKAAYDAASHIIAIGMKRGDNPKIPEIEEVLSVGMAVQNMWLATHALGYCGYWSTGADVFREELANFLGLTEADKSLGFFYLGVPAKPNKEGIRMTDIRAKVVEIKA
ncbi:MAG: nitroreductase [Schleiferiaceae bacterium]|nr:nitroreductase [Schleiferiaceae bacterium]